MRKETGEQLRGDVVLRNGLTSIIDVCITVPTADVYRGKGSDHTPDIAATEREILKIKRFEHVYGENDYFLYPFCTRSHRSDGSCSEGVISQDSRREVLGNEGGISSKDQLYALALECPYDSSDAQSHPDRGGAVRPRLGSGIRRTSGFSAHRALVLSYSPLIHFTSYVFILSE